jgi:NTP pyrophosphatase (non-canonical NTP hydrolase)
MGYLDSFNLEEIARVNKILAKLKHNYPDINWQTELHDYEDETGNTRSSIVILVPLSQFDEAIQIYEELKKQGFNNESSIFDELIGEIIQFRDERNWEQFHNPKDLAISLSLEASELLENFQWKTSDDAITENIENIKDEIADVVIYTMLLSHKLGINLEQAIKEKIQKNKKKYPVDKAFGSRKKYTEF